MNNHTRNKSMINVDVQHLLQVSGSFAQISQSLQISEQSNWLTFFLAYSIFQDKMIFILLCYCYSKSTITFLWVRSHRHTAVHLLFVTAKFYRSMTMRLVVRHQVDYDICFKCLYLFSVFILSQSFNNFSTPHSLFPFLSTFLLLISGVFLLAHIHLTRADSLRSPMTFNFSLFLSSWSLSPIRANLIDNFSSVKVNLSKKFRKKLIWWNRNEIKMHNSLFILNYNCKKPVNFVVLSIFEAILK